MIVSERLWCEGLNREIPVHVRLPKDYDATNERYPVMYMFDGHNLFNDAMATYGRSWRLDQFLGAYDKNFIIVGLECDHRGNNRLSEYCPYDVAKSPLGPIKANGPVLMDWIIDELKPKIDRELRTWPQREATGIAGSSMGGLMAWYALLHHNDVFSKAAALSPSLPLCAKDALKEMAEANPDADTRLYISMGGREGKGMGNRRMLREFSTPLARKGMQVKVNFVPQGQHNEASWEKESPVWFDYLWK